MKIKAIFPLVFSLLSPVLHAENIYTDNVCSKTITGITFPIEDGSVFTPLAACLNGKNITKWMGDGNELTSASYNEVNGVSFFTARTPEIDDQFGDTKLVATFVDSDGSPKKITLLDSTKRNWDKPEESLYNMSVNYYDKKNHSLYFMTDAWAQSRAIHAITFQDNNSLVVTGERFVTDGDLVYVTDRGLVVNKIDHDDQGAYFPSYLVGRDGKEICQIDTRQQLWEMSAPCLAKGKVLKVRE